MTQLSNQQEQAVKGFVSWYQNHAQGFFYLGGYAGTGKSTILPYLVEGAGLNPSEIAFCAPTGKAAKVMTTKMQAAGLSSIASTIHKLIYTPLDKKVAAIEAKMGEVIDWLEENSREGNPYPDKAAQRQRDVQALQKELDEALIDRSGPSFTLRSNDDLNEKSLIVVDEASMVGTQIAQDLMSFGIPILAIGDPGQLPPVKDTPGFTAGRPDAFLEEIHRQAADNPIIWLSKQVREGKALTKGRHGSNVRIIGRTDDIYSTDVTRDHQVIVGRNMTRWKLTEKIRRKAGHVGSTPRAGEPLIVCRNSKQVPDLVNGTFVRCAKDAPKMKAGDATFPLLIEDEHGVKRNMNAFQPIFEEHVNKATGQPSAEPRAVYRAAATTDHFDFGWAITCHKSQGSQWDKVVVHDESGAFREDWSRWLYTAVTRAAVDLTVIE